MINKRQKYELYYFILVLLSNPQDAQNLTNDNHSHSHRHQEVIDGKVKNVISCSIKCTAVASHDMPVVYFS